MSASSNGVPALDRRVRILQVVDIFDALTVDRPYRRARTSAQALDILEGESRRGWWDAEMVDALRCVVNGAAQWPEKERP